MGDGRCDLLRSSIMFWESTFRPQGKFFKSARKSSRRDLRIVCDQLTQPKIIETSSFAIPAYYTDCFIILKSFVYGNTPVQGSTT
jgi:hypothetical protein